MSAGGAAHVISPGDTAAGVLHTGSLYLNSNTTLDFTNLLGGDRIVSSGSLNVQNTATDVVQIIIPADLPIGDYILIDFTSAGTNTTASNFTFVGNRPTGKLNPNDPDYFEKLILTVVAANVWVGNSGASWSDPGSWGTIPNAAGAIAQFTDYGGATVNVDTTGNVVGQLQFASIGTHYYIAPTGTLTLQNTSGQNAVISLTTTSLSPEIAAPISLASNLTVTSNGNGLTISGSISDSSGTSNSVTLTNGLLVLSGTNSYGGATTVGSGSTLRLGSTTALPSGTALTVSGTLDLQTNNNSSGSLTLTGGTVTSSGGAALNVSGNADLQTGVVAANLAGAMTLTKSAAGTVLLSGSNGYSGTTNVSAGLLQLGSTGALPSTTALTLSGGTLDLATFSNSAASLTVNGGTLAGTGGGVLTLSGYADVQVGTVSANLAGAMNLTKSAGGTVVLSGSNGYGGTTTVSAGTLQLGNTAALPSATGLTLSSTGTLNLMTYNNSVASLLMTGGTVSGTGILTVGTGNANLQTGTVSASLAGAMNLTKSASGTVVLSGSNGYSGTTLVSNGLLQLGNIHALPAATALTLSGGTLDLATFSNSAASLTVNGGTLAGTGGGVLTLSGYADVQVGTVSANLAGAMTLTKSAAGTVLLSGSNGYSGPTNVSAGLLQLGSTAALPTTTALTVSGGTLNLMTFNQSVNALRSPAAPSAGRPGRPSPSAAATPALRRAQSR